MIVGIIAKEYVVLILTVGLNVRKMVEVGNVFKVWYCVECGNVKVRPYREVYHFCCGRRMRRLMPP